MPICSKTFRPPPFLFRPFEHDSVATPASIARSKHSRDGDQGNASQLNIHIFVHIFWINPEKRRHVLNCFNKHLIYRNIEILFITPKFPKFMTTYKVIYNYNRSGYQYDTDYFVKPLKRISNTNKYRKNFNPSQSNSERTKKITRRIVIISRHSYSKQLNFNGK